MIDLTRCLALVSGLGPYLLFADKLNPSFEFGRITIDIHHRKDVEVSACYQTFTNPIVLIPFLLEYVVTVSIKDHNLI